MTNIADRPIPLPQPAPRPPSPGAVPMPTGAPSQPAGAGAPEGGGPALFADSYERASAQPLPLAAAKAGPATAGAPNSGQSIQARSKMLPGRGGVRVEYAFSRPLTREQAAQVLFVGGKVPDGVKLVPGEGNAWVLESPDIDTHQAAMRKLNSRTEAADPNRRGEGVITWSGGPNVVSTGPRRLDLKNDFGFVITKRYQPDVGQIPDRQVRALDGKAAGYEVAFDKPMTEKEVMAKLFDQGKFQKGDVKAIPVGGPPAMVWRVQTAASTQRRRSGGRSTVPSRTPPRTRRSRATPPSRRG